MGRTIPSYHVTLEEELKRWERFRNALRINERNIFEHMIDECRRHAPAAGAGCFPVETEGMILSIPFAHHKALRGLLMKVERISETIERAGSLPYGYCCLAPSHDRASLQPAPKND